MKMVITGNMGCGKSTVVNILQKHLKNYNFFYFDKNVHQLYEDENIKKTLNIEFGTSDRRKLSDMVYQNNDAMKKLRSILDPSILLFTQKAASLENVILDMPLYLEYKDSWGIVVDKILCITTTLENQINRVKKRNNFSEEKILSIIKQQLSQKEKEKMSDFIIENNGTEDELIQKVIFFIQDNFDPKLKIKI